jgi:tetratricopeptide (TPR) repeat protein
MALDPYAPCPCGSGKKFKWCCQPINVQIARAFQQNAEGQHDVALRTMDEIAAEHDGNPQVWGRKAELLFRMGKVDDAENALQKAFDLSPDYPFGYFLRGQFRHIEGELPGALLQFRKAASLYDPEAKNLLAQIHALIADCELKLNRPVAARAALEIAHRLDPTIQDFRKGLEEIFGDKGRYPLSARREYSFQSPPAATTAQQRAIREKALASAGTGKLADVANAFAKLLSHNDQDAAAWYNLGLCRAWMGDNPGAIEALDRYVEVENDPAKAAEAWALAEVLRCGQGMEDHADYVEHSAILPLRDPQAFVQTLGELERDRQLVGVQVRQEEGVLTGLLLEKITALTPEMAAKTTPRLGAYLLLAGNVARLWNVNCEAWEKTVNEVRQRAAGTMAEPQMHRGPAHFSEVLSEGLGFPLGAADEAEAKERMTQVCARYLEETWIHRPLIALNRIPPIDAAGHKTLKKKLAGVIQFLEECKELSAIPYDFSRLRNKLAMGEAATPAAIVSAGGAIDFDALGAADLAGLEASTLTDDQAEQAYQAALKLDARELAGKFARELVGRPPRPERPDRYPWYGHLVHQALADGDTNAALDFIDEGEKADCEQNEGRRRNDYELRRAQIHAKRGDIDHAEKCFADLIARVPSEMRFRSSAAEAMLSARQGPRALRFAQEGLDQARKQNDRDSENHFKELVEAAQK